MGVITLPRGINMVATRKAVEKKRCELSLAAFVKAAWSVIEPGQPYVHGWHIDFICAHLEAITNGELNDDGTYYNRLLVNVPPGTMKSLLIGVFWPAWEWIKKPHMRYVCASHSLDLAIRDSMRMRRLVMSEWYQSHWGDIVKITGDQNAKAKFETTATGFRQACSFSGVTGYRGDRVICDDILSVDDANSDAKRESAATLFKEAITSRLNNPDESAIVVVMQRLHEADVSGIILDNDMGYDHIMLPMRFDPSRACVTRLGYADPREIDGELLFPERFPEHVVDRDEAAMGPYACNTGEAPVLMADLSLKRIDQIAVGDDVIGWVRDDGGRSRSVRSTVINVFKYRAPVVKMTLDSGEIVRCTPDHKWWRARFEAGRHEYGPASIGTSLARVCPSSLPDLSPQEHRMAGWLAGFFDGDGSVSITTKKGSTSKSTSCQIHFYQGAGRNLPLCEKLESCLSHFGFKFSYSEDERKPNKDAPCYGYRNYILTNGQHSLGVAQRFLHIVQPSKWRDRIEAMGTGAKFVKQWEKVVSIVQDGEDFVYAIETTTGNYVVWGLASSNSAGQYAQSPEPRGGGIVKDQWWRLWDKGEYPAIEYIVAALDTAYTTKAENDPSALTIWGVFSASGEQESTRMVDRYGRTIEGASATQSEALGATAKVMMMYAWQGHLEIGDLVVKVEEICTRMKVDVLLIENKAAGHSVAQELRRVFNHARFGVQMYDPKTLDKVARLYSIQHIFSEGMVYAPNKDWAEMVIRQTSSFPRGAHDDLVDTVSCALKHLRDVGMLTRAPERMAEIEDSKVFHGNGGDVPLYNA